MSTKGSNAAHRSLRRKPLGHSIELRYARTVVVKVQERPITSLPSNSYTSALLETRHAVIRFLPIVHSTIGYLLAGGARPPHSRGIPMRTHGSSGRWCTPIWGGLEVIDRISVAWDLSITRC